MRMPTIEQWIRLRCAAFARTRFSDEVPANIPALSDRWFDHANAGDSAVRKLLDRVVGAPIPALIDVMVELRDFALQTADDLPLLDGEAEIERERALLAALSEVDPLPRHRADPVLLRALVDATQTFDLIAAHEVHWQWWALRREMDVERAEDPTATRRLEVAALLRFARHIGAHEFDPVWRKLARAWDSDALPPEFRRSTLGDVRGRELLEPLLRQAAGWTGLNKSLPTHRAVLDGPKNNVMTGLAQVLAAPDCTDEARALATHLATSYAGPRSRYLLDRGDLDALAQLGQIAPEVEDTLRAALKRTAKLVALPESLQGLAGNPKPPSRSDVPVADGLSGGRWLTPVVRATHEHQLVTVRRDLPSIAALGKLTGYDRSDVAVGVVQLFAWAQSDDAEPWIGNAAEVCRMALTTTFESKYKHVVFLPDQLERLNDALATDPKLGRVFQAWLQRHLALSHRMGVQIPEPLTPYWLPAHPGYDPHDSILNRRRKYPHPSVGQPRLATPREQFLLMSLRTMGNH